MYIFTIDWSRLLEEHPIGLGKWSDYHNFREDRRIFWDNKTPVGYYMLADKIMWPELYEHFENEDIDQKGNYWWKNGGLLALIGPRTPYVAIHGSKEKILWPASNACIRVIDNQELKGKEDIENQSLINHLAQLIPVWSFVIITN